MDFLKMMGGGAFEYILPGLLIQLGTKLRNKDDNDVGTDDEGGKILIAFAPVIPAMLSKDESFKKKILKGVYNTIGGYLGYEQHS